SLASATLSHHLPDGRRGESLGSLQSKEATPFRTFDNTAFRISTRVPLDGTPVELYTCFSVNQDLVEYAPLSMILAEVMSGGVLPTTDACPTWITEIE